jgi:DNA-binding transcriptional ArsR family regulator
VTGDIAPADPRILRAVAHPVRMSLLHELYARGSATATTLAGAVGQPVNSVSFHLRQLSKYALIEDAPDEGADGRERWWRPVHPDGLHVSGRALAATTEGREAHEVFRRQATAHWQELVARFFAEHHDGDEVWASSDVSMRLTDDEARQCQAEVYAVMRRWAEHGQRARDGEAAARTYLAITMLMPHQTDVVDGSPG